jgi:hypothetical protein
MFNIEDTMAVALTVDDEERESDFDWDIRPQIRQSPHPEEARSAVSKDELGHQ